MKSNVGVCSQIYEPSAVCMIVATTCPQTTASLMRHGYDNQDRRSLDTRGNGTTTAYGYDAIGQLKDLDHDLAGTANDQQYDFAYNAASQIVSRTASNDAYAYERTNATQTITPDGLNRIGVLNGQTPIYSQSGELTGGAAVGRTYGYDVWGQLTGTLAPAPVSTQAYDAAGRLRGLTGTVTARFIHDGDRVAGIYPATGSTLSQRVAPGVGIDEAAGGYQGAALTTPQWPVMDERGIFPRRSSSHFCDRSGSDLAALIADCGRLTLFVNARSTFDVSASDAECRFLGEQAMTASGA